MSSSKMEGIFATMEELDHGLAAVDEALSKGQVEDSREALRVFREGMTTCQAQLRWLEVDQLLDAGHTGAAMDIARELVKKFGSGQPGTDTLVRIDNLATHQHHLRGHFMKPESES